MKTMLISVLTNTVGMTKAAMHCGRNLLIEAYEESLTKAAKWAALYRAENPDSAAVILAPVSPLVYEKRRQLIETLAPIKPKRED